MFYGEGAAPDNLCASYAGSFRQALPAAIARQAATDKVLCGLAALLFPDLALICRFVGNTSSSIEIMTQSFTTNPVPSGLTPVCYGAVGKTAYWVGDTGRAIVGHAMCQLLPNPTIITSPPQTHGA
jgi:hypothetical protein